MPAGLNEFKIRCGFNRSPVGEPAPVAAPTPVAAPAPDPEEVFWSPGMFSRGGLVKMPRFIKWQRGTNSLQMGQELTQYGYVYNAGVYERR